MIDNSKKCRRILVVDDDPDLLSSLEVFLGLEGFEVYSARSGERGLEVAHDLPPDLILLDIDLSAGMRGTEVCGELKLDSTTRNIPVIYLTGKLDTDAMEDVFEERAQGYLMKPFSQFSLMDKIEEFLFVGN